MPDSAEYAIVFADLAGYTALTEAHGDQQGAQVALRFFELAKAALIGGARIVKTLGDGVMIVASDTADALSTANQLSGAVDAEPKFPALRIGVHRGAAITQNGDFFGAAINLTARVMGTAQPGQTLCTETIAAFAAQSGMASTEPLGTVRMKNVPHLVALYLLRFGVQGASKLSHVDPVCRMQIGPDDAEVTEEHGQLTVHFCSPECALRFRAAPDVYLQGAQAAAMER